MNVLSGKQKRFLRSLGQRMDVTVSIGKAGLSEAVVAHLRRALAEHELIKVRLGEENIGADRKNAAAELEKATAAVCVGIVGRTVLLFAPNKEQPAGVRIVLPE
jgi:RNA-binding protein